MINSKTTFRGYRRENGRVGVRNHVIILPVDDLSNAACEAVGHNIKGALAIPHPYGRLQFGADLDLHFRTLIGTGANPNVFYELGLAHALGKRVFLVAEDPQCCRVDFGALTVSKFEASEAGRERLRAELQAFVATPGILSPIAVFSGGFSVAGQPLMARRFCGFLIDAIIAAAIAACVLALAAWVLAESVVVTFESAIVPLMLLYFFVTGAALGTTPGQRLAGLKVTRLDRSQPSRAQKLLRPVAASLNLLTFGVGFLWTARSPRHQAVHDIITRTLVLRR